MEAKPQPTDQAASAPQPSQEQGKQEDAKLSPAELKKKTKAERQARRAAQKESTGGAGPGSTQAAAVNGEQPRGTRDQAGSSQQPKEKGGKQAKGSQQQNQKSGKQGAPDAGSAQQLPVRRRPSQAGKEAVRPKLPKPDDKKVQMFSHLNTHPRRHHLDSTIPKEIHPSVLALGLQMSTYAICGSTARCVAMLLAFKDAIQAYTTPPGTSLARHLTSHYLSPQIDYLKSCRPISESMGNAIRWLKKLIVEIDPATPEHEAKASLAAKITTFLHERITVTDTAIAASAARQIHPGATVLTFAKSALVEQTLLAAHARGTRFRTIVVDSRPLFEGRRLATNLVHAGLTDVEYAPFSALAHAIRQSSLVLLGAHAMLSNGNLQSRAGTANVAMLASRADVPVIVCCESVKFSGKVALDGIALNEVAPAEEMFLPAVAANPATSTAAASGAAAVEDDDESDSGANPKLKSLRDWRDVRGLQVLNLMYDVTPAEYLRMVICEYGSLPPSSVTVVHRLANEGM